MTTQKAKLCWQHEHEQAARMRTFLANNARRNVGLRLLDTDWPSAAKIRSDLLYVVSDNIHTGSLPIVYTAVDVGIVHYRQAVGHGGDYERLRAFLETTERMLIQHTNGLRVEVQNGSSWALQDNVAFTPWAAGLPEAARANAKIRQSTPSEEEARAIRSVFWSICRKYLPTRWFEAHG